MNFIIEGGAQFMIPLIVLLLLVVVLFVRGIKTNSIKNAELLKGVSLFALVFGILGFVLGLSQGLEVIGRASDIAPQVLAGGLKIGLIAPIFGLIIFLLGRLFDIILLWKREN